MWLMYTSVEKILRTFKEKIRKGSIGKALCNLACIVLCKGKELLCTEKEAPPRLIWYRVMCHISHGRSSLNIILYN